MATVTMNVSLSKQQAEMINGEVRTGGYTSASEVVRDALRQWMQRRIDADVAELERLHAGAWDRDTTPEEEAAILAAQREARAEIVKKLEAKQAAARKRRRL